jgi:1,4-dihydroxy-2-naphthoyl-CoA hydrolase
MIPDQMEKGSQVSTAEAGKAFVHRTAVSFSDTDAGGVVFFAKLFDLAHRAYEATLVAWRLPLRQILDAGTYALPIVSAAGEFKLPLRVGDELQIGVTVERIAERSFGIRYEIARSNDEGTVVAAVVKTQHVAIDREEGRPILLPAEVRSALERPRSQSG